MHNLLQDHPWRVKYSADDGDLIADFYIPALACAVRYDRTTGYFSADILTLALHGIEGLVRNQGHMRLIVGCTLDDPPKWKPSNAAWNCATPNRGI